MQHAGQGQRQTAATPAFMYQRQQRTAAIDGGAVAAEPPHETHGVVRMQIVAKGDSLAGADQVADLPHRHSRRLRNFANRKHVIAQAGGSAARAVVDVTATDGPAAIVTGALARFGRVDALVNAAGIIASGPVTETTDEGWDAMMDVNVRAPFRLIREAAAALGKARG